MTLMTYVHISLLMKGTYSFSARWKERCHVGISKNAYSDSSEWTAPGTLSRRLQKPRPTIIAYGVLVRSSGPRPAPLLHSVLQR